MKHGAKGRRALAMRAARNTDRDIIREAATGRKPYRQQRSKGGEMVTVSFTIDALTDERVQTLARKMNSSRSAVIRSAVQEYAMGRLED